MATGLRGAGGNYGAGSNRYGSDPKLGGGGKGSGSSRGTGGGSKASGSPSGGVSTGGGLRGAGGNYGPGSGRPGSSSGGSKTNTPTGGTSRVDRSLMGMGSSRLGSSALGGVAKQAQNNVGPSRSPVQSAAGAEEMVRRGWVDSQIGSMFRDPAINPQLPNALGQGMWNQRIADANRVALGQKPIGAFGERSLAPWKDAGFRTKEEALDNFRRGKGIKASFHNYGLAADIVTPGMPNYNAPGYSSWEDKFARANADLAGQIPSNYGVRWGGTFSNVDPAHFQLGTGSRSKAINTFGTRVADEGVRPGGVTGSTASFGNGPSMPAGTMVAGLSPQKPLTPFGSLPAAPQNAPSIAATNSMLPGFSLASFTTPKPATAAATASNVPAISSSGSIMDAFKRQAQNLGLDPNKVITASTDAVKKLADGNKKVADVQRKYGRFSDFLFKMAGGGSGAASNSAFGNPQDRRPPYYPPVMSQPQQVAEVPQQTDPLSTLNNLMANMRAKGATPQQIAYVQTLIDDLMKAQVA